MIDPPQAAPRASRLRKTSFLGAIRIGESLRGRSTSSDRVAVAHAPNLGPPVWSVCDDMSHLTPRERSKLRTQYDALSPEVRVDRGAGSHIHCVSLSLGASSFATADSLGKACIWSSSSGSLKHSFDCGKDAKGQDINVWSCALQSVGDELLLATGDSGGILRLWRSGAQEAALAIKCNGEVRSVDLSPTGEMLASGDSSGALGIWNGATGQRMCAMVCGKAVRSIALSSTLLASGDEEKRAKVWDVTSGELRFAFTCGHNVLAVEISLDEHWLATGDAMSKAKVWSLFSGHLVQTLDCGGWIYSVSFADSNLLATGDQHKRANLWDLKTGELVYSMECAGEVNSVAISADKASLLVGDATGSAHLFQANTGALIQTMECGTGEVITVDLSNDHRFVATGGIGTTAKIWEMETGDLAHEIACGGMCMGLAFSRDGSQLAMGVVVGKSIIFDLSAAKTSAEVTVCEGPVFCVLLEQYDGQPVLVTGDVTGKAIIWDASTAKQVKAFDCLGAVRGLDMSRDGSVMATGNMKGDASIWASARRFEPCHESPTP